MSEEEKKDFPNFQELVKMLRAVRGERQADIPTAAAIRAALALAYIEMNNNPARVRVKNISEIAAGR